MVIKLTIFNGLKFKLLDKLVVDQHVVHDNFFFNDDLIKLIFANGTNLIKSNVIHNHIFIIIETISNEIYII